MSAKHCTCIERNQHFKSVLLTSFSKAFLLTLNDFMWKISILKFIIFFNLQNKKPTRISSMLSSFGVTTLENQLPTHRIITHAGLVYTWSCGARDEQITSFPWGDMSLAKELSLSSIHVSVPRNSSHDELLWWIKGNCRDSTMAIEGFSVVPHIFALHNRN